MSWNPEMQTLECDSHTVRAAFALPAHDFAPIAFTALEDSVRCPSCVPGKANEYRAERNARYAAHEQGWQIASADDRRDLCPAHVERGK